MKINKNREMGLACECDIHLLLNCKNELWFGFYRESKQVWLSANCLNEHCQLLNILLWTMTRLKNKNGFTFKVEIVSHDEMRGNVFQRYKTVFWYFRWKISFLEILRAKSIRIGPIRLWNFDGYHSLTNTFDPFFGEGKRENIKMS